MALEDPIKTTVDQFKGPMGDERALERVRKDFARIRAETQWRRQDWLEYNDLWLGHLRIGANYPLTSRSHIPLLYGTIESMTPHIIDALYDDRQFLNGLSRTPDPAARALAKDQGNYMNYVFISQMKYLLKLIDTIRGSLIYGTMYQQVILRTSSQPDFRNRKERRAQTELEASEAEESALPGSPELKGANTVRKMFFNGPDVRVVPPHDIFPDLPFKEIDDMRFLIHRDIVPASQIIANAFDAEGKAIYKNLEDMLKTKLPGDAREDDDDLVQGHSTQPADAGSDANNQAEDRLMERQFYWMPNWLIIVVNRQVVIFNERNPLPQQGIPYVAFRPTRDIRFHHGIGVPQVLRSIAKTMNVILNQRLDNLNLVLNPMHKIRREGGINTAELRSIAGGYVHMENLADHDLITFPDVTATAMNNLGELSNWADSTSGVQEFFRGQAPSTSRTPASTVSQILNQTTRRFSLSIRGYQDSVLEVVRMAHQLVVHFGDPNLVGRFLGKDGINFVNIERQKLVGADIDFQILGRATSGNPDLLLTKLMDLEERWRGEPDIDPTAFKKRIFDLSGLSNIEEIVRPAPVAPAAPGAEAGVGGQGGDLAALLAGAGGQEGSPEAIAEVQPAEGPTTVGRPTIRVPQ